MSKPNLIQIFFWNCAGSTASILKRQETEYAKHTVMGMAVFLTAVLAFFTGRSAFSICFGKESEGLSIVFGVVWAIIIFNIDRSFTINASYQSKLKAFFLFSVRFSMAILISLSLSTTIELKLFETEISKELKNIFIQELQENYATEIQERESRIQTIDLGIKSAHEKYKAQLGSQKDANKEMKDFIPIGKDRVRSKVLRETAQTASENTSVLFKEYQEKVKVSQNLNKDLDKLRSEITKDSIQTKHALEIEKFSKEGGLLDRYKALRTIIEIRQIENLSYLLTTIMAMVEISPLLIKIMYPKGNYEAMIEARSSKDKEEYTKELDFEKKRFTKVIEITDGRLNLEEKFADSKLNPSNLRISNHLSSNSEENLKSNLDSGDSKEFIFYTSEEKAEHQNQANQPKNGNIIHELQKQLKELWSKLEDIGKKKKNEITFLAAFTAAGLFAQNFQALIGMYKEFISLITR
jgi:Domain of unknown function (DUF4407)